MRGSVALSGHDGGLILFAVLALSLLEKGTVLEQGTHKELVARKGAYYNLYGGGGDSSTSSDNGGEGPADLGGADHPGDELPAYHEVEKKSNIRVSAI